MTAKRGEGHIRKLGGETEYRLIRTDGKQVLEHRHKMELKLGRRLKRAEIVHHKDEDGLNNNIDNLVILTQAEHRRLHGGPRFWKITLETAIAMRDNKKTLAEIAAAAGVTWTAIHHVFKRRGISTSDVRRTVIESS